MKVLTEHISVTADNNTTNPQQFYNILHSSIYKKVLGFNKKVVIVYSSSSATAQCGKINTSKSFGSNLFTIFFRCVKSRINPEDKDMFTHLLHKHTFALQQGALQG